MIPQKGTRFLRLFLISALLTFLQSSSQCKPSFPYSAEPIVRANLADNAKDPVLFVYGNYKLTFRGYEVATISNEEILFTFSPNGMPIAKLPNQEIRFSALVRLEALDTISHADTLNSGTKDSAATSAPFPDRINFHLQTFPGSMEIFANRDGTFRIVNVVSLETYLRGVVPNELVSNLTPDEFHACMAQAIAARNYAFYKLANQDSTEFDIYSDTRDQVYSGIEKYRPIADSAIKLTSGMIVEYDGQPARCFFHSTCGGHTESVQNIWQGQPALPYLQGVSDIDSATGDPYCVYSPSFIWASTFSRFQLDEMLKENLAIANPTYALETLGSDVTDIQILDRFSSFRVDSLRIRTNNGDVYFVRGDRTRYFFKNPNGALLRSSFFKIKVSRDNRRRITNLVINGQGSGHGVGMCQWGAIGMSRLGFSYVQILKHYYPGTEIRKVY